MSKESNKNENVLNIVAKLLTTEGEKAFTMDRLATESGLSRATLYRRFGGRDALLKKLATERNITVAELDRPDMRTRILQAAGIVFGQTGLAQSTIDQIAQEAEVGTATIYRHFGSKTKLVEAFVQSIRPQHLITTLTMHKNEDMEKKLTDFTMGAIQFIQKNRQLITLIINEPESEEAQKLFIQMQNAPNRTLTSLTNYFEAHIAASTLKKQNSQQLAIAFFGLLLTFTVFNNKLYTVPPQNPEDTAQFIVKLFLNGIK